jgi:hypothetical protein
MNRKGNNIVILVFACLFGPLLNCSPSFYKDDQNAKQQTNFNEIRTIN